MHRVSCERIGLFAGMPRVILTATGGVGSTILRALLLMRVLQAVNQRIPIRTVMAGVGKMVKAVVSLEGK